MHKGKSERSRSRHARAAADPPEKTNAPSGFGSMESGEDFDQRRLARTVAAEKPMDFAASDQQIDVIQSQRAAEPFGKILHDQRIVERCVRRRWRRRSPCDHSRPQSFLKPATWASPYPSLNVAGLPAVATLDLSKI